MTKVKLQVREKDLAAKILEVESKISFLQKAYDHLSDLGCENLSVMDLTHVLDSDGSIIEIKRLVLRGKSLEVAGLKINPEFIQLDANLLREISNLSRRAPSNIDVGNYVIENGRVKCSECVHDRYREVYTLFGSQRAKDVIEEIESLCDQINDLRSRLGATDVYHPLSPVESWMKWDGKKYVPSIYHIAQHIK